MPSNLGTREQAGDRRVERMLEPRNTAADFEPARETVDACHGYARGLGHKSRDNRPRDRRPLTPEQCDQKEAAHERFEAYQDTEKESGEFPVVPTLCRPRDSAQQREDTEGLSLFEAELDTRADAGDGDSRHERRVGARQIQLTPDDDRRDNRRRDVDREPHLDGCIRREPRQRGKGDDELGRVQIGKRTRRCIEIPAGPPCHPALVEDSKVDVPDTCRRILERAGNQAETQARGGAECPEANLRPIEKRRSQLGVHRLSTCQVMSAYRECQPSLNKRSARGVPVLVKAHSIWYRLNSAW